MSRWICFVLSLASVRGVRATRKRRADAAAVTGSRVCAESIVEISTSNGSSWLSSAIFSTAGSSRLSMARASARITASTARDVGFGIVRLVWIFALCARLRQRHRIAAIDVDRGCFVRAPGVEFERRGASALDVGRLHAGVDLNYAAVEPCRDPAGRRHGVGDDDRAGTERQQDLVHLRRERLRLLGQTSVPQRTIDPRREALERRSTRLVEIASELALHLVVDRGAAERRDHRTDAAVRERDAVDRDRRRPLAEPAPVLAVAAERRRHLDEARRRLRQRRIALRLARELERLEVALAQLLGVGGR